MSRVIALRRIAKLYGVVEEMHSVALQQASAGVQETERALHTERTTLASAAAAGRIALTMGEREDWLLAHAYGEISAVRAGLLEGLKAQRVEVESTARTEFLASRLKTEQMKQIVVQMDNQSAIEEGRRTQAVSDDRYAARRTWLAGRPKSGLR